MNQKGRDVMYQENHTSVVNSVPVLLVPNLPDDTSIVIHLS